MLSNHVQVVHLIFDGKTQTVWQLTHLMHDYIILLILTKRTDFNAARYLFFNGGIAQKLLISIINQQSMLPKPLCNLHLRSGYILHGSKVFQMCSTDIGNNSDIRTHDLCQKGKLLQILHSHFHNRSLTVFRQRKKC